MSNEPSNLMQYGAGIIGVVLSIFLYVLFITPVNNLFPYVLGTLFCLYFLLAYDGQHILRLIVSSFVAALVLSLPFYSIKIYLSQMVYRELFLLCFIFLLQASILNAFHAVFHQANSLAIQCRTLMIEFWNAILTIMRALLFTVLFEFLFYLFGVMILNMGIPVLSYYYYNPNFQLIAGTTLFFIGLGFIKDQNKDGMRRTLLEFINFLLLFLTLFCIIYGVYLILLSFSPTTLGPMSPYKELKQEIPQPLGQPFYDTQELPHAKDILINPSPEAKLQMQNKVNELDQKISEAGMSWQTHWSDKAYKINNQGDVYGICRAKFKEGYEIGSYHNNRCTVTYSIDAIPLESFEILTNAEGKVEWGEAQGFPLGAEYIPNEFNLEAQGYTYNIRPLVPCLVSLQELKLGKLVDNSCRVAIDGKEVGFTQYKVLTLTGPAESGSK